MTLLRIWRADRTLAWLTALLALCAIWPLFVAPFLPFPDLPNNTGAASLLWGAIRGYPVASYYYKVQAEPVPYWGAYLLIAFLRPFVGALWAAKGICGIIVLFLPLATMRLLVALGRSPRLGLWAFALSWDHNLYAGWVTFMLGMCMTMVALAWLIECTSYKRALVIAALTLFIALTHVEAVAFFLVAGGLVSLVDRRPLRAVLFYAIASTGTLIAIYPWLKAQLKDTLKSTAPSEIFSFDWHTPAQKATNLFAYTLDDLPSKLGMIVATLTFVILLAGPAMLGALPRAPAQREGRGRAVVLFLAASGLYFLLPMEVNGPIHHWYTYPRYATFMLLSLLLLPRPRLDRRYAWALLPGIAAALCMDYAVTKQLRAFAVNSAPFLEIMQQVKPRAMVLPLIGDESDETCRVAPYNQFHSYVVAAKLGYDPYLFDNASNPLLFRGEHRPPAPPHARPSAFSMAKYGHFYDYVLIQGLAGDPFAKGGAEAAQVTLVREAGRWRLYAVKK